MLRPAIKSKHHFPDGALVSLFGNRRVLAEVACVFGGLLFIFSPLPLVAQKVETQKAGDDPAEISAAKPANISAAPGSSTGENATPVELNFSPPLSHKNAVELLSKLNKFAQQNAPRLAEPNSTQQIQFKAALNSIYAYSLERSIKVEAQLASKWRRLNVTSIKANVSQMDHEFSIETTGFLPSKPIRGLAFRAEDSRILIRKVEGRASEKEPWLPLPCENLFLISDFPKRETCYFKESYFLRDLRISLISDQPQPATLYCYALVAEEESPLLEAVYYLHDSKTQAAESDWESALTSLSLGEKALRSAWLTKRNEKSAL